MAILDILQLPDTRLNTVAEPILEITPRIDQLAKDMLETMYTLKGIGLAGTQVNQHIKIFVLDVSEEKNSPLVVINPKIIKSSGEEEFTEGCMSIAEISVTLKRPTNVTLEYQDLTGAKHTIEADGLLAECIQHEVDHLKGITIYNYLSPLKKKRAKAKLLKLQRQK